MTKIKPLFITILLLPVLSIARSLGREFQQKLNSIFQQHEDAVGPLFM